MSTIFIVPIEPIDSRYTKQWYENIPAFLKSYKQHDWEIVTIDGHGIGEGVTPGAFLDFAGTNIYKASQVIEISRMFMENKVKSGDKFLITDAWNTACLSIRYMADLLGISVEIHGIWHAGHYDPTDILGMKMRNDWPSHAERSFFYACDYNWFATNFHKDMFLKNLNIPVEDHGRAIRSGQPHDLIVNQIEMLESTNTSRWKGIVWPHRYNEDKQPDIAESIGLRFPIAITSKMNLSKTDFYSLLYSNGVIFSCSLHENLGISIMEAVLAGVIPVLPDRCSYSEMYLPEFIYPSEWTESYVSYMAHKDELDAFIRDRLENRHLYMNALEEQKNILKTRYLTCTIMADALIDKRG